MNLSPRLYYTPRLMIGKDRDSHFWKCGEHVDVVAYRNDECGFLWLDGQWIE